MRAEKHTSFHLDSSFTPSAPTGYQIRNANERASPAVEAGISANPLSWTVSIAGGGAIIGLTSGSWAPLGQSADKFVRVGLHVVSKQWGQWRSTWTLFGA